MAFIFLISCHIFLIEIFHLKIGTQAPLSMGFSWQEYWSGLPFLPLGDLLDPGIKPMSPALADEFLTTESPGKLLPVGENGNFHPMEW